MIFHGIKRLQPVAGDTKHGGIIGGDSATGNEFLGDAHGHAASGFGKDAFGLG